MMVLPEMRTGLFYAALFDLPNVVDDLLRRGLYTSRDVQGFALLAAVIGGSQTVIEHMLARNITFDVLRSQTSSTSELPASNVLLLKGAILNPRPVSSSISSPRMWSALHFAAMYGIVDVARLLLLNDADANSGADLRNITPLHLAAYYGHVKLVILLVQHLVRAGVGVADSDS
jgi:hypothetical protein